MGLDYDSIYGKRRKTPPSSLELDAQSRAWDMLYMLHGLRLKQEKCPDTHRR